METLLVMDHKLELEKKVYDHIFDMLNYEKVIFNGMCLYYLVFFLPCVQYEYLSVIFCLVPLSDLQMKPYRTDEFMHKLFYETSRFSAFNHQWVVKARINNSQRDPALSSEREMTYQVKLDITSCFGKLQI